MIADFYNKLKVLDLGLILQNQTSYITLEKIDAFIDIQTS